MSSPGEPLRDEGLPGPETVITTFYSFKGGVGRSMALYAVAHRLAARRRRVLMVDADLEAPGLTIAALPRDETHSGEGLAEIAGDIIADLLDAAKEARALPSDYLQAQTERLSKAIRPLPTPPQEQSELLDRIREELPHQPYRVAGVLGILPVGRVYDNYEAMVERIPLQAVFGKSVQDRPDLEPLIRSAGMDPALKPNTLGDLLSFIVRYALKHASIGDPAGAQVRFDYVLLDSRTGLADIAAFCVRALADKLVVFSGLNEQNLAGLRWILGRLSGARRGNDHLIPVLSPVPEAEMALLGKRLKEVTEALKEFGITGGIHLLHYHPWLALSENPFAGALMGLTRLANDYNDLAGSVQRLNRDQPEQWIARALDRMERPLEAGERADARHAAVIRDLSEGALGAPGQVEQVCGAIVTQTKAGEARDPRLLDFLRLLVALDPSDPRYLGALGDGLVGLTIRDGEPGGQERVRPLFEEAFAKYAEAVRIKPDMHEAWFNWGNALAQLVRIEWKAGGLERVRPLFEEAFAKYAEAVRVKPDKHEAWNNWGSFLAQLARLEWDSGAPGRARVLLGDAFAKLSKAVQVKPDKYEAWTNWGSNLDWLARRVLASDGPGPARPILDEASAKCAEAVRIKSDMFEAWHTWGYALAELARIEWEVAEPESARPRFDGALAKLAKARELGAPKAADWGLAASLCELAAKLDEPDSSEARSHAAGAAEYWDEARRLDPSVAQFWRAALAAQTGREAEALDMLSDLVRKDPTAAGEAREHPWFDRLRADPRFIEIVGAKPRR